MNASDTLKVRKVRFFVEPKVVFFIPRTSHFVSDIHEDYIDYSYDEHFNVHNKTTLNFGLSGGFSIRLNKYFRYELSLTYNYYNTQTQRTGTYQTGWPSFYSFDGNQNCNTKWNFLGISNGLSFTVKKIIFTNSVLFCTIVSNKSQVIEHNNLNNTTTSQTYRDNMFATDVKVYYNPLRFMSEHKIGYSFLKDRIEAYVGINILYNSISNSPMGYSFGQSYWFSSPSYTPQSSLMPFTSVRINF